jgi:DNA-binding ferritin-like protein (Dps family)
MKKIVILTSALFLGVAFMAYFYFSKLGTDNDAKDLALQSATNNAALVFSFQNDKGFYDIIEGQQLLQQVLGKDKMNLLKQLKAGIIDDNQLNRYLKDQQVYISVLPDSNKTLNFLITLQIQQDNDIKKLYEQLKLKKAISEKSKELYTVKVNDSLSVYLGIHNQVLTLSTSLKLINDASVRLIENPFTEYIKGNNRQIKNVLAHVYINFNQAPLLLKNIIAGNINGEIGIFNKQNSFAVLNYNFSKEKILFSGNTELKDQLNYLKLFENTAAQNTSIQNILPDNTANFALYAYDDYGKWLKKLNSWQTQTNGTIKANAVIKNIKDEYRIDLNAIFPAYTKNQFILFQLSTTEKLGAISLINGEKVKQLLLDVSADYNEDIKLFKSSDILYSYFGEPFKKFGRPYYTIVDNNLVVANNASTVQSFLNDYKKNRLLIQTPQYLDAVNQISTTCNVSYYINTKNSADIFRNNIQLPFYKHLRADSGLKSFDTFYYQMSADKNKFITNLLLNKYLRPEIPDSLSNR